MIFVIGLLAIQVFLIIDVIRNGRNQMWIMALMFLPMASTAAYFIVEILPRFQHHRHVRTARAQISAKLDPKRELRAARDQLDIAQTTANRLRLADALTDLGRHAEALPLYQAAVGSGRPDLRTGEKYTRSLFQNDRSTDGLAVLDAMQQPSTVSDRDRIGVLRARLLEELDRKDEAAALYDDIVARFPGDEVRCRYAALLLAQGRTPKATSLLEEVEHRIKRLPREQRTANAAMYDWAMRELARMRSSVAG